MKRILVPMDFSKAAMYALDAAKEVAEHTPCEITVFNVVERPNQSGFSSTGEVNSITMDDLYILRMIEKTRDELFEVVSDPKFEGLDIKVKIKVEDNNKTVPEEIALYPADLIIMGTEEVSGLEEMFMGSDAEKVVRLARCPVITIKEKPQNFRIKEIVYASTFNDDVPPADKLIELQNIFSANLHLLYVNKSRSSLNEERARERMDTYARRNNLRNYTINVQEASSNAKGISMFAMRINADVIAMATHARKGFLHFIMGSLTEDMVNHSNRMMFTFHMHDENVRESVR
jgi:nucleotide-binding universal stress UspA family protein